jgi:alkanesulfonate monooxygenase SsuD/methylene tetrahydromethanopterin reductase-like flavin-dependent oxidoreductase (luciferase family)
MLLLITLIRVTKFGVFIVPGGEDQELTLEQIVAADRAGLDYVGIQDHPYQRRYLDTWTLLSFAAARTERVRFVPDVLNLPLRLPTLIAKAAASLDLLSGGRLELGLGAGAFWDAVAAMGGPKRTPGGGRARLAAGPRAHPSSRRGQQGVPTRRGQADRPA